MAHRDFRPGSINATYRRCGKSNCACARPEHPGHGPRYLWTRSVGGKTRTRQLTIAELGKIRRELATYRKFAALTDRIIALNEAICEARPVTSPPDAIVWPNASTDEALHLSAAANEATGADVAFSHISIEVGHFEPTDFSRGVMHFANRLRRVAPWLDAARAAVAESTPNARMSTCFLVDDYTAQVRSPAEVIPRLLEGARRCGISIDYLVRESACVDGGRDSIARLVEGRVANVELRAGGDVSPPIVASAWLSDSGQRPPLQVTGRPTTDESPESPRIASPNSTLIDTGLWVENSGGREWSCSFLAAVWQLSRLGLLDNASRNYMTPQKWEDDNPQSRWEELPPTIQINHDAAPFQAYRTISILESRYLPVEAAVRSILEQVSIGQETLKFVSENGACDGVTLPARITDRINYVFVGK
jgi:hypothetical protein